MLVALALAASFLAPPAPLVTPQDDALPRSGIAARDLGKLAEHVVAFFAAEDVDDRGAQLELEKEMLDEFAKAGRRADLEQPPLAYVGDWNFVFEAAKEDPRSMRSGIGNGFFKHVFEDKYGTPPVATVLSVPRDYSRQDDLIPPAIVVLKGELGLDGNELEDAVMAKAQELYAPFLETHIVLIPLGLSEGDGRRAETVETEGSWLAPEARQVFFTGLRVLTEQLRFDRSRLILDGWGAAGSEAVELAALSPSWFAGVINRGGALPGEDVPVANLRQASVLVLQSEGAAEPGPHYEGLALEVVPEAGPWDAPTEAAQEKLVAWAKEQQRDLAPKEVVFLAAGLEWGSSNWCVIHDLSRRVTALPADPDYPRVKASIDAGGNVIDVESVNVGELRIYLSDALVDLDQPVTIRVNGEEKFTGPVARDLQFMLENRYYMNSSDYGVYTASVLVEDIDLNLP